ncbi:unnamed protein product [Amoebophrya sp. A25]|nr:unnamed protein product [Amoebophrya sp. A25]|eukprot:GSA25T00022179001.1
MGQCWPRSGRPVGPVDNTIEQEAAVIKTLSTTEEEQKIAAAQSKGKRGGVSAAHLSSDQIHNFKRPIYPKTPEEAAQLRQIIQDNEKLQVLFGHLDEQARDHAVDAMRKVQVACGESIIQQGDRGDAFYIVETGSFGIFVARGAAASAMKVMDAGPGACFGELALMYDAPRAATVTCTSDDATVWALDRDPFRILLVSAQSARVELYEGFLSDVELFKDLNRYELGMLSDLLASELYEAGEPIVRQGEQGTTMYILEDGECKAYIDGSNGEIEVKHYVKQGDYFGEIALIKECARRATVRASGTGCSVLVLKKQDFDRVIGPIVDTLVGLLDTYPQYRAFFDEG